jgi:TolB-like protein
LIVALGLGFALLYVIRQLRSSPQIQSLAVLPLANFSGDPQEEPFADAVTEELTTELARIKSLRVISRTSAMRLKGTRLSLQEIGRELGVDAVVEGSIQRSGDRVRISAQLISVPNERHLWAETYERSLKDTLLVRSEVSSEIANHGGLKSLHTSRSRKRKGLWLPKLTTPT